MDKKAIKGFLIGYDGDDGYRVWCKETNTLIRSRDVVFEERIPQHRIYEMPVIEDPQDTEVQVPVKTEEEEEISEEIEETPSQEPDGRVLRNRETLKKPKRYEECLCLAEKDVQEVEEPETYEKAISCEDRAQLEECNE